MTTLELKKILINRITEINDISFLNELNAILDSKDTIKKIQLTDEQKSEILASKQEISKGLVYDNCQVNEAFVEWLKEK
jgi:hypothetical protein